MLRVDNLRQVTLTDYIGIVGEEQVESVKRLAELLKDRSFNHINSTSFGGGVAEILLSMVPLMKDVGLDVHWEVIRGSFDFFKVTKKMHNALQGMTVSLTEEEQRLYIDY